MHKKTTTLDQFLGLNYVSVVNVPIKASSYGDVIDVDVEILEQMAAKAIIKARIPLRGKEVNVLRRVLGLSLERFAAQLGLTSGSIFKWEKKPNERLHPMNEVAVRAFFAEKFKVSLPGKYSELLGTKDRTEELVLKAS